MFIRGDIVEGPANGSLDGVPMTTTTAEPTGSAGAGCTITQVTTSGMVPDGDESTIRFSSGSATADVTVVPPGAAMLLVNPSSFQDSNPNIDNLRVELTLLNAQSEPISGVALTGQCDGGDGTLEISTSPGVTDEDGQTVAFVAMGMTECAEAGCRWLPADRNMYVHDIQWLANGNACGCRRQRHQQQCFTRLQWDALRAGDLLQ